MIWLIPALAAIFFIFKGVLFGRNGPSDALDWMMMPFIAGVFSIMPLMICVGFAGLLGLFFKTKPVISSRHKLRAIRDKDGISGQFFLGSGAIHGNQYYFYYRINADGSVTPGKVYANGSVRVYEEEGREDAELVSYKWELIKEWAYVIAFPSNTGGYSYDFHVPKGTIRTGFTM